ncbi:voltage-gated potassium channel [Auriscalpium vulgare]|uniref:Voltage-gated potassium channel n=1 Tax=Auriscalpium vulgare TaxID=40419 RepID=A0ACB8RTC6_9AGAM|nr:voltage-gated potassium channel [Auriscalpium vulgare]
MASTPIPLSSLPYSNFLTEQHDDHDPASAAALSSHSHTPDTDDDVFAEQPSLSRRYRDDEPQTALPSIHPRWKRDLFELLERPTSSSSALLVHWFVTGLIAFSAVVTILETVPAFHEIPGGTWFGLETSIVALFTVEYLARAVAWSYSWGSFFGWMGSFFGILDLLAILPYYIEMALQLDTSALFRFSILRTFRLLRVFRPFRYNSTLLLTIEVMYLSFRRSQHALLALGFFVLMVLVVFSTLLYFIERGSWDDTLDTFINSNGDPSQFASIPAAAWFVIVTITTVGYGEITPRSFLGRLITIPLLVFGLLLIALPSFVLGREFSIVWNEMTTGQLPQTPRLGSFTPIINRIASQSRAHIPLSSTPNMAADAEEPRPRPAALDFAASGASTSQRELDLTNRKLAQNQTELSRQITELRAVMERQGEMLKLILEQEGGKRRAEGS